MSLSNAERERLIKLVEECGEVIQMCSKIMLHGYDEVGPIHKSAGQDNRTRLEQELGDVHFWLEFLGDMGDIDYTKVLEHSVLKYSKAMKYTRYQPESEWGK